jgi:hypothetical protein
VGWISDSVLLKSKTLPPLIFCGLRAVFEKGCGMNIFCDVCRISTRHNNLTSSENYAVTLSAQDLITSTGENVGSGRWLIYALFRCVVCSKNTVLVTQDCCTEYERVYGDIKVFPKPSERLVPEWHIRLENHVISDLMIQSCKAFNEELYSLALMGYRAIIDSWLDDKVGNIGNFSKKLDEAKTKGHIDDSQKSSLKVLVDAGHAAAHRGWKPTKEESQIVMDCVDCILKELLPTPITDLSQKISNIERVIPPRARNPGNSNP